MSAPILSMVERVELFCQQNGITRGKLLGEGKDGGVWLTSRHTAVKAHQIRESYHDEIRAYIRLHTRGIQRIADMSVPVLTAFDDDLWIIEMSVVSPPFIVDFASARLDVDPQLIEDPDNTFEDFVRSRFDERTDEVMGIYYQLIAKAGMYLTDLHPQNIKFAR